MSKLAHQIEVGAHLAWLHDEGWSYGHVHTFDGLRLHTGDAPRKVHVLLPREYYEGGHLPVVFMNDGQTALFSGGPGGKSWGVGERLSSLREAGRVRPVVVVAVHPVDRGREYTHAAWFPGHPWGGLPDYARYVGGPLRNFILQHYRVSPDRDETLLLGSSHGGLAAFYTAMAYPQYFGLVGALSPSFWVGLGRHGGDIRSSLAQSELLKLARSVLADRSRRPRLWVDWGERGDGGRYGAQLMAELLEREFEYRRGVDLSLVADPEGEHDELSWGRRFESLMAWFFPAEK